MTRCGHPSPTSRTWRCIDPQGHPGGHFYSDPNTEDTMQVRLYDFYRHTHHPDDRDGRGVAAAVLGTLVLLVSGVFWWALTVVGR